MSVDVLSASEQKERCGLQSEEESDVVEQQGSRFRAKEETPVARHEEPDWSSCFF